MQPMIAVAMRYHCMHTFQRRMPACGKHEGIQEHARRHPVRGARAILEKHDSSYFPSDNDDFMPVKKDAAKGDY